MAGGRGWETPGLQHIQSPARKILRTLDIELPQDPGLQLLGIYPRQIKHVSPEKIAHNVHSSIIYNNWEVGIAQMPISWWLDKQNMAYL